MNRTSPASQPQTDLIKRLISEKELDQTAVDWIPAARARAVAGTLTSLEARGLITHLLTLPRKAGAAAVQAAVAPEGMHVFEGVTYKVQVAKNGSGNRYAKALVQEDGRWSFEYAPGAIKNLSEATVMTAEAAAAFGALYGICCSCGKDLTDEDSIHNGYGRKCAQNHGWSYEKAPAVQV